MDERYERSADMRLLEFEREARGVPQRIIALTSYTDADPIGELNREPEDGYVQSASILVASIDAQPKAALIAGAVVTVSLAIANDGDATATGVRLILPLPVDTSYRLGSLIVDGRTERDAIASDLFGNGADLGAIEPRARRTVVLKLNIEAGLHDIRLSPHLSALSGAVLGSRGMRLSRRAPSPRDGESSRPFYESDEAEHSREPLAPPPVVPTIAVVQPSEFPAVIAVPPQAIAPGTPAVLPPTKTAPPSTTKKIPPPASIPAPKTRVDVLKSESKTVKLPQPASPTKTATKRAIEAKPEAKPKTKPRAKPKSGVKAKLAGSRLEPQPSDERMIRPKLEVVRSPDDRLSVAAQGAPILIVRMDRKRLATLTALFSGPSFGMIAHYLVLNAIAVTDPLPGDSGDGSIAKFVAEQERLLSRALISTRLGKTPAPDSLSATLPAFRATPTTHIEQRTIAMPPAGETLLFRAFTPSETAFLERTVANEKTAPFMRAAQLFVGLCSNDAVLANERDRHQVSVALTAYAALATAEISRIFLRARLNPEPELFKPTDPSFDDAARTVLAALGRTIS